MYYKDRYAGELLELDSNHFRFTYDSDYLENGVAIAFRLPLTGTPYESKGLPPFFEGLTSEGWLRKLQSQTQGIAYTDSFGLLLNNGRDLVGAVTIMPAD
ncbi:HipA N-terminal domain-containing protein [Saccharospirillum sp. HFRX-1]|uniref:HipA N-terminal domain-containing protein n=1 Tax=unclassified Saccharospirillum TaxID=2633430 RepID=UPI003716DFE4